MASKCGFLFSYTATSREPSSWPFSDYWRAFSDYSSPEKMRIIMNNDLKGIVKDVIAQ
jgi:hypothetical protein